jgi:hypothetical protein
VYPIENRSLDEGRADPETMDRNLSLVLKNPADFEASDLGAKDLCNQTESTFTAGCQSGVAQFRPKLSLNVRCSPCSVGPDSNPGSHRGEL